MATLHSALQPLEAEIQAFEEQLPALRKQFPIGTFVLFVGSCMVGGYRTYSSALEAGYDETGGEPFLVKQVSREGEDVQHVYALQA